MKGKILTTDSIKYEEEEEPSILSETAIKSQIINKLETSIELLQRNLRHKPESIKLVRQAIELLNEL